MLTSPRGPLLAGRVATVALSIGIASCGRADDVELTMTPSRVSACEMPVAVEVQWDASMLGLSRVVLEVNNVGTRPRVWLSGESRGSQKTGTWAHDGFTVTLKAMNGVVLGRRTLTTERCPGKDWL